MNPRSFLRGYAQARQDAENTAHGAPVTTCGEGEGIVFSGSQGSWFFPSYAVQEAELTAGGLLFVLPASAVLVTGPADTLRGAFEALAKGRLRRICEREGVVFTITRAPAAWTAFAK